MVSLLFPTMLQHLHGIGYGAFVDIPCPGLNKRAQVLLIADVALESAWVANPSDTLSRYLRS